MAIRILIADDHGVVRQGLRMFLALDPELEVVGEAADGDEAVRLARELQPDVVGLDIFMPGLNGIEVAVRMKGCCRGSKVLVLTAYDDNGYLRQLLEAGASGYVLKRAAAEELVKAIRVVAAGGVYLDPTMAGKVVSGFVNKKKLRGEREGCELSGREEEVLRLVAWGYTNKEVAGYLNISVKTVETHKTNLMEKLDLNGRSDIVRYALRRGWLSEA
jgi:DNA-binding NarL/FixJ family response regulator